MDKDRRVKGCPNEECQRMTGHYRYKATDQYCTICGSELVFVCPGCFGKLADQGPKHIYCATCEAEKEDRKKNTRKKMKHFTNQIVNATKTVVHGVSEVAEAVANTVSETARDATSSVKDRIATKKGTKKDRTNEEKKEHTNDCIIEE